MDCISHFLSFFSLQLGDDMTTEVGRASVKNRLKQNTRSAGACDRKMIELVETQILNLKGQKYIDTHRDFE